MSARHLLPLVAAVALGLFSPTAARAEGGEHLLMNPPKNWQVHPTQKMQGVTLTRFFPPGENEKNWTQILTVQVHTVGDQSPRGYIDTIANYTRNSCEATGMASVKEGPSNGYPTAATTISCNKALNSGMGSFILILALRGKQSLYVVQRQWHGPAYPRDQYPNFPAGMLQEWSDFTRMVSLCDSQDSRHPCPAGSQ